MPAVPSPPPCSAGCPTAWSPLSVMLAVTRTTGSYAVAGTVMAAVRCHGRLPRPARAGLIDRYGPRRALPAMALALTSLLLGALAAAIWRPGAPTGAPGVARRRGGSLRAAARPDHADGVERARPDQGAAPAGVQPRRRRRGTALRLGARAGGRGGESAAPAVPWSWSAPPWWWRGPTGFVTSPAVGGRPPVRGPAPKDSGGPGTYGGRPGRAARRRGRGRGPRARRARPARRRVRRAAMPRGRVVAWVFAALSAGSAVGGMLVRRGRAGGAGARTGWRC